MTSRELHHELRVGGRRRGAERVSSDRLLNQSTGGSVGQTMMMMTMTMVMMLLLLLLVMTEEMQELRIDHLPSEKWAKRKKEE